MVIKVKLNVSRLRRLEHITHLGGQIEDTKKPIFLTSPHTDTADVLLSQEVPNLDQRSGLLNDNVDGEMGIHRAHLVPETLGEGEMCISASEIMEVHKYKSHKRKTKAPC